MTSSEAQLRAVLESVRGHLPEQDVRNVRALIDAGESAVALENLCTQLFEYDAVLDKQTVDQVEDLTKLFKLDPAYIKSLRDSSS